MKSDLMKKGKELIALGESLCSMAEGEDTESDDDVESDDYETSAPSPDKEDRKKTSLAMLSKKFGKSEY